MKFELTEQQQHNLLRLLERVNTSGVQEAAGLLQLYTLFQSPVEEKAQDIKPKGK